jgi:hypothetical protein
MKAGSDIGTDKIVLYRSSRVWVTSEGQNEDRGTDIPSTWSQDAAYVDSHGPALPRLLIASVYSSDDGSAFDNSSCGRADSRSSIDAVYSEASAMTWGEKHSGAGDR